MKIILIRLVVQFFKPFVKLYYLPYLFLTIHKKYPTTKMSLVYIMYHDENIFDIGKKKKVEDKQPAPHVSKHKKRLLNQVEKVNSLTSEEGVKVLTSSKRYQNLSMGHAVTPLRPPCNFLRKGQGVKWRRLKEHVCPKSPGMPPVPRWEGPRKVHREVEKPSKKVIQPNCPTLFYFRGHKHRADFVAINIEKMSNAKPKYPEPKYIDTPYGHRCNLLHSGLIPQYVCRKHFAKVPCYLKERKKFLDAAYEICEQDRRRNEQICMKLIPELRGDEMRRVSKEDHEKLMNGLKTNFKTLFHHYQTLPLYTDTIGKKLRKGNLEKHLRQLEQDIYFMQTNPNIVIGDI